MYVTKNGTLDRTSVRKTSEGQIAIVGCVDRDGTARVVDEIRADLNAAIDLGLADVPFLPVAVDRADLIDAIAQMPDEAFGYVVLACCGVVKDYGGNGGFMPASRASFASLGAAIDAYIAARADAETKARL